MYSDMALSALMVLGHVASSLSKLDISIQAGVSNDMPGLYCQVVFADTSSVSDLSSIPSLFDSKEVVTVAWVCVLWDALRVVPPVERGNCLQ